VALMFIALSIHKKFVMWPIMSEEALVMNCGFPRLLLTAFDVIRRLFMEFSFRKALIVAEYLRSIVGRRFWVA